MRRSFYKQYDMQPDENCPICKQPGRVSPLELETYPVTHYAQCSKCCAEWYYRKHDKTN